MAYYATPYGMQGIGSQGLNAPPSAPAGTMAPAAMPGGSSVPPPSVPPANNDAAQGNAMNEQLAAFFASLRGGMGSSGGNPLLETISRRGAQMGEGSNFGSRFGVG